jgi:hypothetical protein
MSFIAFLKMIFTWVYGVQNCRPTIGIYLLSPWKVLEIQLKKSLKVNFKDHMYHWQNACASCGYFKIRRWIYFKISHTHQFKTNFFIYVIYLLLRLTFFNILLIVTLIKKTKMTISMLNNFFTIGFREKNSIDKV